MSLGPAVSPATEAVGNQPDPSPEPGSRHRDPGALVTETDDLGGARYLRESETCQMPYLSRGAGTATQALW